jgi:hypothetical protein
MPRRIAFISFILVSLLPVAVSTEQYLTFERCQAVQMSTLHRFVVFHFCDACGDVNKNCQTEVVLPLSTYLRETVTYHVEKEQAYCQACDSQCAVNCDCLDFCRLNYMVTGVLSQTCDACFASCGDNNNNNQEGVISTSDNNNNNSTSFAVDCDTCADECARRENLEENGYIDATTFVDCQLLHNGDIPLYAGPVCDTDGLGIHIGVFQDENCLQLDPDLNVEDYLVNGDGVMMDLSYSILNRTFAAPDTTHSCAACYNDGLVDGTDFCALLSDGLMCHAALQPNCALASEILSDKYDYDGNKINTTTSNVPNTSPIGGGYEPQGQAEPLDVLIGVVDNVNPSTMVEDRNGIDVNSNDVEVQEAQAVVVESMDTSTGERRQGILAIATSLGLLVILQLC